MGDIQILGSENQLNFRTVLYYDNEGYEGKRVEIFALGGDLSSEIRLMKTDNVTVTDFFHDYVHVHNTQTSLISRRIMKEASLYII